MKKRWQDPNVETVECGLGVESLRVGSLPGRQVTIYDKLRDITVKRKSEWWTIWECEAADVPSVTRIEARLGKNALDHAGCRSVAECRERMGTLLNQCLEDIRLTRPDGTDSNRSRWPAHPVWAAAQTALASGVAMYSAVSDPRKVLQGLRAQKGDEFRNLITSHLPGFAASTGRRISELPWLMDDLAAYAAEEFKRRPEHWNKKQEQAEARFASLR